MYCCLRRDPHFLCSMLNDTLALDSADEYRLTGTETSPNEIVAVAMERAGMDRRETGEIECARTNRELRLNDV